MSLVYLDTSALVKLHVQEPGTADVQKLLTKAEAVGTAIISKPEAAAAFSKAVRVGYISLDEASVAWDTFQGMWLSLVRLALNETIMTQAGVLAFDHGLRGYDAVHLAVAIHWQDVLSAPVVLATYDRQLWNVGQRTSIAVWPEICP